MQASKTLVQLLSDELSQLEVLVESFTSLENTPLTGLIPKISKHILLGSGKKIRGLMLLSIFKMLSSEKNSNAIQLALAVELMHTATLLHDDVIDDSSTRRGKTAANVLWGNKASILVGDYMLSQAFSTMVETGSMKVLMELSNAAIAIARAEIVQLHLSHDFVSRLLLNYEDSLGSYMEVITGKTGALFEASCKIGAVLANAPREIADAAGRFGLNFGICFQMIDDLLDYIGDPLQMGKHTFQDLVEKNLTLPLIHFLKMATDEEKTKFLTLHMSFNSNNDITEDIRNKILQKFQEYNISSSVLLAASQYHKLATNELDFIISSGFSPVCLKIANLLQSFTNEMVLRVN